MSKPIVIALGEILWDMLPTGKRAGGAPVNFAYHASQNGAESYAISAVGNDELGAELLNDAHKAGINTLVQTNEYPTGTVAVALTNGIPEYTIVQKRSLGPHRLHRRTRRGRVQGRRHLLRHAGSAFPGIA